MESYLSSCMVADPLRVRNCCLVTDEAAAVVMVRADNARELTRRPAFVLGAAAETDHRDITSMPDLTVTAAAEAGRRAYAQARIGPQDVDVVELYDAFTINTILSLRTWASVGRAKGPSSSPAVPSHLAERCRSTRSRTAISPPRPRDRPTWDRPRCQTLGGCLPDKDPEIRRARTRSCRPPRRSRRVRLPVCRSLVRFLARHPSLRSCFPIGTSGCCQAARLLLPSKCLFGAEHDDGLARKLDPVAVRDRNFGPRNLAWAAPAHDLLHRLHDREKTVHSGVHTRQTAAVRERPREQCRDHPNRDDRKDDARAMAAGGRCPSYGILPDASGGRPQASPDRPRGGTAKCSIVNVSSYAGRRGTIGQINYGAAKAGVLGLAMSAARE